MLSQGDVDFMKSNRAEITESRTELITIIRVTRSEADPYTNEPVTTESTDTASVVWKEVGTVDIINGVQLQTGDVKVSFDATVDLTSVKHIVRNGSNYALISMAEKGIGTVNRVECIARRST
jgi:hypothetical protein